MDDITLTKVANDTNGNPRYVCHFLNIASTYDEALSLSKKIGGRKFHNKQYGGGIVFKGNNPELVKNKIRSISKTRV